MKIKNLTGYMLGNEKNIHYVGEQWDRRDSDVWVCPSLAMARNIMEKSQQNITKTAPVWTTIYRVKGQNICCTKANSGVWLTNQTSSIFIEGVVCHQMPELLNELEYASDERKSQIKLNNLIAEHFRGRKK